MNKNTITTEDTTEMTQIVAQLVRESVVFEVSKNLRDEWEIELTGGY